MKKYTKINNKKLKKYFDWNNISGNNDINILKKNKPNKIITTNILFGILLLLSEILLFTLIGLGITGTINKKILGNDAYYIWLVVFQISFWFVLYITWFFLVKFFKKQENKN